MPRQARIDAPGALHHIIIRGIERKKIFRKNTDRDDFLERLGTILSETATPCFAWTLMSNHVHLLIRTGKVPVATIMRKLLTGYAIYFNRKYNRHGQLFQNRYKSILCQEDTYLLELVRYIHLNPLRAKIVQKFEKLDKYRYCGHSVLLGNQKLPWQDVSYVLSFFGKQLKASQRRYREFVEKGIALGKRPELVGGGLIRSAGGWKAVKSLKKSERIKGDERILGDSDFVLSTLAECKEQFDRRYRLRAKGIDLDHLLNQVSTLFELEPEKIMSNRRYPVVVRARSVLSYWAVSELGYSATELANLYGLTQSAVTKAVTRGEKLARENELKIDEG